ncbi:Holliday junction branch migration DNA helicase RuvB [Fibrobacter succinogenes]|uniref:Holliday junction branch migration DNA helicase RuvB n=1 Tax=Fibrobacter succinogenes TaxID=833 RepID=UPI0015662A36|nr:Holliday junction branch migration DNA helicase RuvB [Fibrobacter succinogenes]
MEDNRIISPQKSSFDENDTDRNLRPPSLAEFTGQEAIKESLSIAIEAAKHRGDALDHCLFAGPPGLGKTTLAGIIAKEMGVSIHITSGPVLEKASDLAGLLTSLQENDVLFIDEIHRLNRTVEEYLYPAMEDFRLDIMLDSGPAARSVNLPLKHFTLVGATTRSGQLTGPLRDRFGLQYRLELYNEKDIVKILMRSASILGVELSEDAALLLGGRCRGTPRIANRVLRRCRDVAQVRGTGIIDVQSAQKTLDMLGIDSEGLDPTDRRILSTMIDMFDGGPVGIGTISAAMGEEANTIEEVYEPYLIQKGLLNRTPRGRVATRNAYMMLHKTIPANKGIEGDQLNLF